MRRGIDAVIMVVGMSGVVRAAESDLPDPLTTGDGTRVTSAELWRTRRRPEILRLFQTHVYGRAPLDRPGQMRFEVFDADAGALGGAATRKQVRVRFTAGADSPSMHILIFLPNNAPRPVGLFVGLNFSGNHAVHADPRIVEAGSWTSRGRAKRGSRSRSWPIETIVGRGYGVATIHNADIDPDRHDGFRDGVHGLFDARFGAGGRPDDAWGTIGAWAWGLSRAMDYFETDGDIDQTHVAVLGHSRLGKTALWAAAQDERFALAISNDSGCTGAALSRRRKGETVKAINDRFPHWFCRSYKRYDDREHELPVDQHMLIALVAPRPVYVASATKDAWADPEGEFLSCVHAEPVYRLFGFAGMRTAKMPPPDRPIHSDCVGYHLRTGKHALTGYDWKCYMDFADAVWGQAEGHRGRPR